MIPALQNLVDRTGVEPVTMPCKGIVFPTIPTAQISWRPARESNPGPQFWRLICYRNTCETNFYTLTPVCVSKYSKLLRLPVRKEYFDTPDFYQLRCRHSLPILRAAHIIAVFSVSAGSRSLCHIMKNPGVFSSGVLVRYTNIV